MSSRPGSGRCRAPAPAPRAAAADGAPRRRPAAIEPRGPSPFSVYITPWPSMNSTSPPRGVRRATDTGSPWTSSGPDCTPTNWSPSPSCTAGRRDRRSAGRGDVVVASAASSTSRRARSPDAGPPRRGGDARGGEQRTAARRRAAGPRRPPPRRGPGRASGGRRAAALRAGRLLLPAPQRRRRGAARSGGGSRLAGRGVGDRRPGGRDQIVGHIRRRARRSRACAGGVLQQVVTSSP